MAATVTVNDVLDGHVGLDIECLDRIYLNGYLPSLQMAGQVVSFPTSHPRPYPCETGCAPSTFTGPSSAEAWPFTAGRKPIPFLRPA